MNNNSGNHSQTSDSSAQVPYKLASLQTHPEYTRVTIGDVTIGGDKLIMVAGPCAIESSERALKIARDVKKHGADLFRGGAFKPRTSPYSF